MTEQGAGCADQDGTLLAAPFLTVSVNSSGERGLLGVAFDPNFPVNQYVYGYYTTSGSPIHNRVSRFTAMGDVVPPGSEVVILELENLSSATNHNGGALHFAPDGTLYVALAPFALSPTATYSVPSGPKWSAPPLWFVALERFSSSRITTSLPGATTSPIAVKRLTRLWIGDPEVV